LLQSRLRFLELLLELLNLLLEACNLLMSFPQLLKGIHQGIGIHGSQWTNAIDTARGQSIAVGR
jgi:hypothetical protein